MHLNLLVLALMLVAGETLSGAAPGSPLLSQSSEDAGPACTRGVGQPPYWHTCCYPQCKTLCRPAGRNASGCSCSDAGATDMPTLPAGMHVVLCPCLTLVEIAVGCVCSWVCHRSHTQTLEDAIATGSCPAVTSICCAECVQDTCCCAACCRYRAAPEKLPDGEGFAYPQQETISDMLRAVARGWERRSCGSAKE